MREPKKFVNRLIDRLDSLREKDDRAAFAALRRVLTGEPAALHRAHAYVQPGLPADLSRKDEDRCYLVAALYAEHHDRIASEDVSFGSVFRSVMEASNSDSLEKRFVALLSASSEDLDVHLRHAVALARSKGVAVSWARLLNDLLQWDHPDQYIQRRWARDFWAIRPDKTDTESDVQAIPIADNESATTARSPS